MTDPTEKEKTTEELLQDLLQKVSLLQQEVTELKGKDNTQQQSCKRPRDGDGPESQLTHRDGNNDDHDRDGSDSDPELLIVEDPNLPSTSGYDPTGSFSLSEEGEAFFETIFSKKMEYPTRKATVAKYGQPDSRWTKCPQLDPVVEGILSPEALKQDKVTYRSQEMWLEAAGPLAAILEGASEGTLTLPEVIPMIQASLMLMGDASLHQSSL